MKSYRYNTNFISSIISTALVLFLLGMIGVLIIHGQFLSRFVRENLVMTIMLKENASQADIFTFQKKVDAHPMVLSTNVVTPDEAARRFIENTGEDFFPFLGYNPIPYSVDVHVKAEYATTTHLETLQNDFIQDPIVKNIYFDKNLTDLVNRNIARISVILAAAAIMLVIISIVLINNTMRLYIYSKRFLIKSMLLVGASHSFIRKPFVQRAFLIGVIASLCSSALLILSIRAIGKQMPELAAIFQLDKFFLLLVAIFFAGIVFSLFSTIFAIRKYVKLDTDILYYEK